MGVQKGWKQDKRLFDAWKDGRTGVPFVDSNMRELKATGFMSNRGRQNVASFLTKDLELDWRLGAEWFEYLLVSICTSLNIIVFNFVEQAAFLLGMLHCAFEMLTPSYISVKQISEF